MKFFVKGQVIRVAEYDSARYIYAFCGANIIPFRIYKTNKDGTPNDLYAATSNTVECLKDYIFAYTHYVNKTTGKDVYILHNIHTGGISIDKM